jgi:hypothetical protein
MANLLDLIEGTVEHCCTQVSQVCGYVMRLRWRGAGHLAGAHSQDGFVADAAVWVRGEPWGGSVAF